MRRPEIKDVAMWDTTAKHLFQAQRLRAKLHMIVQPLSHLAFFILYRYQLSRLLLYYIGKTAQTQSFRPYPDPPAYRYPVLVCRSTTITALVPQVPLDHMRIIQKLAQRALVIKAARAIFQRIQIRYRQRI